MQISQISKSTFLVLSCTTYYISFLDSLSLIDYSWLFLLLLLWKTTHSQLCIHVGNTLALIYPFQMKALLCFFLLHIPHQSGIHYISTALALSKSLDATLKKTTLSPTPEAEGRNNRTSWVSYYNFIMHQRKTKKISWVSLVIFGSGSWSFFPSTFLPVWLW